MRVELILFNCKIIEPISPVGEPWMHLILRNTGFILLLESFCINRILTLFDIIKSCLKNIWKLNKLYNFFYFKNQENCILSLLQTFKRLHIFILKKRMALSSCMVLPSKTNMTPNYFMMIILLFFFMDGEKCLSRSFLIDISQFCCPEVLIEVVCRVSK